MMITTIKINKELKLQKYEHNGIKLFLNPKSEHKTICIMLNENEIELLYFIMKIIHKKRD